MTPPRKTRQAGFTLLEMLVALTVLGLLVVGLSGSVRNGLALWDAQARRVAETGDLDATARLLRSLLTGLPLKPPAGDAAGTANAVLFKGEHARLSVTGEMPTGFGSTRLAEIEIALRDRRLMLSWRPHRHEMSSRPPPQMQRVMLAADVERLDFAYWGAPDEGGAATWLEAWEEPDLPELIRVRLGFGKGDARHWPDLIAAPRLADGGS